MGWYFFPWSLQYILAAFLAFGISLYLIIKNIRSRCYQAFFFYGVFTSLWGICAFLHRNAPSAEESSFWIQVGGIFYLWLLAPLLLAIIYLVEKRRFWIFLTFPAVCMGLANAIFAPVDVSMTDVGWTYKTTQFFFLLNSLIFFGYAVAIIVTAILILRRQKLAVLRKKATIILSGFICFQVVGMLITNALILRYPQFPPSGGLLSLLTFLFIAYAISLPVEEITIPPGKPLELLANNWLEFLRKLREVTPGKELGEDVARFRDALYSMGLSDAVKYGEEGLIFNADQLASLGINELIYSTVNFVRKQTWTLGAIKEYTNVFVSTYKIIMEIDKKVADGWLNAVIRKYGGFLDREGVLAALPKEVKIPEIFEEMRKKKIHLLKEEVPTGAYKKLKEALQYGFECLIISKLEPKKVEERYDVSEASIFWLTFKEDKRTINPKDFVKLKKTISEFVKRPGGNIILLDCFDQIMLANGFEKAEGLLREVKDVCRKNNASLLISINPEMFEKEQISVIEKEFEGVE